MNYKIYCDMDGVLANFNYQFERITSQTPKDFLKSNSMEDFWKVTDENLSFWSRMPMMRNAHILWNYLADKNVTLLTTPSPNEISRIGKRIWKSRYLKGKPQIIFSDSKHDFANSRTILIDDFKVNLNKFRDAGGIGIRCYNGNATQVVDQLKALLND
jgi:hypothetical protein